jgi:hypothetical protein
MSSNSALPMQRQRGTFVAVRDNRDRPRPLEAFASLDQRSQQRVARGAKRTVDILLVSVDSLTLLSLMQDTGTR